MRFLITVSAAAVLVGCVSNSGTTGTTGTTGATVLAGRADGFLDALNTVASAYETHGDAFGEAPVNMPKNVTATYAGLAVLATSADTNFLDEDFDGKGDAFLGLAALEGKFGDTTVDVSGTLSNFIGAQDKGNDDDDSFEFDFEEEMSDADIAELRKLLIAEGGVVDGTLTIKGSNQNPALFTASLSGELEQSGRTTSFGGKVDGIFTGENGEGVMVVGQTVAEAGRSVMTVDRDGKAISGILAAVGVDK